MKELDIKIGKRLRKARIARGYKSARSFAIENNIPESTYSQHETGKRSLNPEMLCFYSEKFNVHPGWLLDGNFNQNGNNTRIILVNAPQFKASLRKVFENMGSETVSDSPDHLVEKVFNDYFSDAEGVQE